MSSQHEDMVRYRECVRSIWNRYLRPEATWDEYSQFKAVERALFDLIAMRSVHRNDTLPSTDVRFRAQLVEPEVPILIQLSAVEGNVVWGPWIRNVHPDEVRFEFLEFFDWDVLG